MKSTPKLRLLFVCVFLIFLNACIGAAGVDEAVAPPPEDPAEVAVGERLFLETRFAQFFAAKNPVNINEPLPLGDPVMDFSLTTRESLPGSFAGQSMNCRSCHLVDEQLQTPGGGMRSYDDFARRSPIPNREDGRTETPRNSPPLVNSLLPTQDNLFLHFDGEFSSIEDLVRGTFSGRNFGWLSTEHDQAVAHLARIIREDDGTGALAGDFEHLPYQTLLAGTDPEIPEELRLPEEFRVNVATASDGEIFDGVAKLVGAYVRNLVFIQDANGEFDGSPYDLFLKKNQLPRKPAADETDLNYSRRLLGLLNELDNPVFVTATEGSFRFHIQDFVFGPSELQGLKMFLAEAPTVPLPAPLVAAGGIGNCLTCHTPPRFSDFKFHNVGVSQEEFEDIHGEGQFAALFIPDFFERNSDPDQYLPPNPQHPTASGPFLAVPSLEHPEQIDLGVWNVFGNPAVPGPQKKLQKLLCEMFGGPAGTCEPQALLPFTIGLFKTPGLRNLGHSGPYFHNGQTDELLELVAHYWKFSGKAREGMMRNPPQEFLGMALRNEDLPAIEAFLKSLNEDYE